MSALSSGALWDKLTALELDVDEVALHSHQLQTGRWTRITTRVELSGAGQTGAGEDVNYSAKEQRAFQSGAVPRLSGRFRWAEWCDQLDRCEQLFFCADHPASRIYRRWAFEAAALDLALRQRQESLSSWLGLPARPVRFAASMGLGDPPSTEALDALVAVCPQARFKIDLGENWTREWVVRLAQHEAIDVIDFKAHYHGSFEGPKLNAARCSQIVDAFPHTLIEDPLWSAEHTPYLMPIQDRISWDAPIHSLSDLLQLPFKPSWVNMKPSRFGSVSELFRVYAYCSQNQIQMYGGGQFELGVGRDQIQSLAALFHPDGPNDVAPVSYHSRPYADSLPTSPLHTSAESVGFGAS